MFVLLHRKDNICAADENSYIPAMVAAEREKTEAFCLLMHYMEKLEDAKRNPLFEVLKLYPSPSRTQANNEEEPSTDSSKATHMLKVIHTYTIVYSCIIMFEDLNCIALTPFTPTTKI